SLTPSDRSPAAALAALRWTSASSIRREPLISAPMPVLPEARDAVAPAVIGGGLDRRPERVVGCAVFHQRGLGGSGDEAGAVGGAAGDQEARRGLAIVDGETFDRPLAGVGVKQRLGRDGVEAGLLGGVVEGLEWGRLG